MDPWADLKSAIKQRDARAIMQLVFEPKQPVLNTGYFTENELWDFKRDCPKLGKSHENAWADLAKEVLGMHNGNGGVLFFGISDNYSFVGASNRLDSKQLNDGLHKFLSDRLWVDFNREFIQKDQSYLGVALIPPRGPSLERFQQDAPVVNGTRIFLAGYSALRVKDSTHVLTKEEADHLDLTRHEPVAGKVYAVDEPYFRILQADYSKFVYRPGPCGDVIDALKDDRVAVVSVIGIGGIGKTALATWAVQQAYEKKWFEFIISTTAKDRELTEAGIRALQPSLTSFESLLDSTLTVLGFPEYKSLEVAEKENRVRSLLQDSHGLLYVDNLETVDDARVIQFLETLPRGAHAVVTSRRTRVRTLVRPVDLKGLSEDEVDEFIKSLASAGPMQYVSSLAQSERGRIGDSCDRIPLAIRWTLARSRGAAEAVANAEALTATGKRGEELLEFSFRRVFDRMPDAERSVLHVIALFQKPQPTEAILIGTKLSQQRIEDAINTLQEDALLQSQFDPDRNDYVFTLLPMARSFVLSELSKTAQIAEDIRKRLTHWYEADDIRDLDQRLVVRELRQGTLAPELGLVDLAEAAERRGEFDGAAALYEQAISRSPRSWRAARAYAEFYRHVRKDRTAALRLYERAAANAPRRGSDRALIFREYGFLLRDSGDPRATDLAIEAFETAMQETPNDPVALYGLASMLDRKGAHGRVIKLLSPVMHSSNAKSRERCLPLLLRAYEEIGEALHALEVKKAMGQE